MLCDHFFCPLGAFVNYLSDFPIYCCLCYFSIGFRVLNVWVGDVAKLRDHPIFGDHTISQLIGFGEIIVCPCGNLLEEVLLSASTS